MEGNTAKLAGFSVLPQADGSWRPCPELMTEDELIRFLRIPEISNAKDLHNVIENLKRMRDLPRLHLCKKVLYPTRAILEWIESQTDIGGNR